MSCIPWSRDLASTWCNYREEARGIYTLLGLHVAKPYQNPEGKVALHVTHTNIHKVESKVEKRREQIWGGKRKMFSTKPVSFP